MMNSIQPILNNYLPMSLVPRQSLLTILENVAAEQSRSKYKTFFSNSIGWNNILLRVTTFTRCHYCRPRTSNANCHSFGIKTNCIYSFSFNCGSYASTGTGPGNQMEIRSAIFSDIRRWHGNSLSDRIRSLTMYRIITVSNMPRHDCHRNRTWILFSNTFLQRQRRSITDMRYRTNCPSSDGKSRKLRIWNLAYNVCNHCWYSIWIRYSLNYLTTNHQISWMQNLQSHWNAESS